MSYLIIIYAFGAIIWLLLLYFFFRKIFYRQLISRRLQINKVDIPNKKIDVTNLNKQINRDKGSKAKLAKRLSEASINVDTQTFIRRCITGCLIASVLAFILTGSVIWAIIVILAAPIIINILLGYLIKKRVLMISTQLPSVVDFISSSLKSGFSLMQALNTVATEENPVIAEEFSRVLRDINVGKSYDEAFNKMIERNPIEEMEVLVSAILISKETGGNLTHVLDIVSSTMREKATITGEIRSLTAQGRLSGIILGCLPFAVFALMYCLNPAYASPLFTEKAGRLIILYGLFSQAIGVIFIRKIVKIEW